MLENKQMNQVTWELMSRTGQAFFTSLVEHLATSSGLRVAFIVESMDLKGKRVKPLASWGVQGFRGECEYNTTGTPCERLAHGAPGIYPNNLLDQFPNDNWLQQTDMQAYVAIPLLNEQGHVLGHLGVLDDRAIENSDEIINLLELYAHRVKSEIIRKKLETEQNTTLQELHDSELLFNTLFDNTSCGLLFADPETARFVLCNRRICEMLGYSKEELRQLAIADIHREEDLPEVMTVFKKLLKGERSRDMNYLVRRKDGSLFDAKITNFWIRYHGKDCMVGAYNDVTGNIRTERALRLEKEKLASYLDNAAVMTVVLDDQGTVLLINRKGCDVLGRPVQDILGRNWFNRFIPERIRDEVKEIQQQVITGRNDLVEQYENLVLNARGEERLISWRNSIFRNQRGEVIASLSSGIDITDERNAELELESARQRLQFVVKNVPAIIFACEANEPYNINYLTDNAVEQLGYKSALLMGRSGFWSEFTHPDDLENLIDMISELFSKGQTQAEVRIRLQNGNYNWYQNNLKLVYDGEGKPLEIIGYLMNVDRTKCAELALQEHSARLAYAQKLTHVGNWERDLLKGTEQWSGEIYRIFGYAPLALTPSESRMLEFVHPDDRVQFQASMHEGLASKEKFDFVFRVCRSNNEIRHVRALNEVVRDQEGKAVTLLGTLQDVTERFQAEAQLRRAYDELRQLADHLQSAREDERMSIARGIHDEMAQSLTAQKIDMVRLKSRLPQDDAFLTSLAEDILQSINQTIDSVQRILMELRPALLDDLGLLAAIEWQVEQFQLRTDIQCHLTLPDEEPKLTSKERTALFRIMQEALLNILRHSGATVMKLELFVDGPWLSMNISDNGKGVSELDVSGSHSFGLMGMRERAHIFGGLVTIKGEDGKGTTVSTRIPFNNQQKEMNEDA
jgi:PAS domain S-box-containing protein